MSVKKLKSINNTSKKLIVLFVFAFALVSIQPVYAAPGDLDTAFGSNGLATTEIGTSTGDTAYAAALQSDGKIVAVGATSSAYRQASLVVVRYYENGSLDDSFGTDGKVVNDFSLANAASAVAIQPTDGKILVAGSIGNTFLNEYYGILVRYNTDGSIDNSFATNGVAKFDPNQVVTKFNTIALQSDGKILAAGVFWFQDAFVIVRYLANGSIDTTFGSSGIVTTSFTDGNDIPTCMVIQLDGKIVIAGTADEESEDSNFVVARYNTDGTLDSSFGSNGWQIFTSAEKDVAFDLDLQTDGKILVAGGINIDGATGGNMSVVRFDNTGSVDTTFGNSGRAVISLSASHDRAYSVHALGNGKIVISGAVGYRSGSGDFAIVRLLSNGNLDYYFGTSGSTTTSFTAIDDVAFDSIVQPDGKIIVVGSANIDNSVIIGPDNSSFALARYLTLAEPSTGENNETTSGGGGG